MKNLLYNFGKLLQHIGTYLCNKFKKQTYTYEPSLSNEELASIKLEQAKFIYDNAKNILIDIDNAIESLNKKADFVFKHFCTFISAFFGLCFYKDYHKNIIKSVNLSIAIITLIVISIPILIYCFRFSKTEEHNSKHNEPKNTISERALHTMQTFYIVEAIDIQKYAIPKHIEKNIKKAKSLNYLIIASLFCSIVFIVFLFYSFFV